MVYNRCVARQILMTTRAPHPSIATVGLGVLVLVGGLLWFGLGTTDPAPARPDLVVHVDDAEAVITVHVSGAVASPGVVRVPVDSRTMDAIVAAGGATRSADLTQINLAATVRDGERVAVPYVGQDHVSLDASVGLDINAATAADLEELPGVGPVLAERIVAYRNEHGSFSAVEDLLDVPGIGEAKLSGMRDAISSP
jgi:competence protein ComEA